MSDLLRSATAIMSASERRLEIASHNVANITTPGFKRSVAFAGLLAGSDLSAVQTRLDAVQGKLIDSAGVFDLALDGAGAFVVREGDRLVTTRQGSFARDGEGRLADPVGRILQQAGGGDLLVASDAAEILADGTVVERDQPIGRIALAAFLGVEATDGDIGAAEALADGTIVRQGMLEASNVSSADEMIGVMAAMRQAEAGARFVQLYDDLTGRAMSSLGQGGR